MRYSIGILGCGVMSSAIFQNIDLTRAAVYDISENKAEAFLKKGAVFVPSMQELVASADTVFLGIKPQNANEVFAVCDFSNVKTIISIMAGISTTSIAAKVNNPEIEVVRVMPNLPAMVGEGMSALTFYNASKETQVKACDIFNTCGKTVICDEPKFDAVTSISGSGPAYVYLFINSLIRGGIAGGLDYADAKALAVQTLIGAAKYAETQTDDLSVMVERVCSKGGTTIEAVQYFNEQHWGEIVEEGVRRCREKSKQLSELTK